MKISTIYIIILLLSYTALPQGAKFDSLADAGINQIYNIEFSKAENNFRQLIADYPENPAGRFFLSMIDWWKILIDIDNESNDDMFFQKLEDVIYQCDKLLEKNENDVNALFFKGGAIGFRGRLRAIRESWLKSVDDGREALPIVQHAAKIDPENKDVLLGYGIYNYYASVIPNQFPLIKPLMIFFPSGDKAQGLRQLDEVALKGRFSKYEAQYFLMTIYSNYENNPYKADEYANMLLQSFPKNPVFIRWKGRVSVQKGATQEYYGLFRDILDKCNANQYGYAEKTKREACYYLGMYYKTNKNADSSLMFFRQCADLSQKLDRKEESGFLVNATLFCGMMSDALGRREEALAYYKRCLDLRDYSKSRETAKSYTASAYKMD